MSQDIRVPRNISKGWGEALPLDPRPITICLGVLWLLASILFLLWSNWISGTPQNLREFSSRVLVLILMAPCCTFGAGLLSRSRPRLSGIWLVCAAALSTLWFFYGIRGAPYVQAKGELGWMPLHFVFAPMFSLGLTLLCTPPKTASQRKLIFLGVIVTVLLVVSSVVFNDGWRSFLMKLGARP
jgi:hypothetical protein